jgi:CRP/FNR family cyclic AMP-dependent transcriptional regulator
MSPRRKVDNEVVEALTKVTDLDKDVITTLATVGTSVGIPEGWSIILETTPADSAYIVLEGTVEIRQRGEVLGSLGPGDVFGEIALVNHQLRTASVITTSHVQALHVGHEAITELLEKDSTFADNLRSVAQQRLER